MNISTGLVSVTFRALEPEAIVELVKEAKLDGIEWGGDVHVPHGDITKAEKVGKLTTDAGLKVISYGSYYNFNEAELPFSRVLKTASALGARHIRVWAGSLSSESASKEYRNFVVKESRRIYTLANKERISLSFEFHSNSLTDTTHSAIDQITNISRKNFGLYWQPRVGVSAHENSASLSKMLPYLTNIHAYYWHPDISDRRLLVDGISDWMNYLGVLEKSVRKHSVLLEFVKDDSPQNFLQDAETLLNLL